jgi:uncharacterized surface protein with fasciclin (FAS1) repeats
LVPATKSLWDIASSTGNHKSFLSAMTAAGLAPMLKEKGPYTLFAPTDAAFAALQKGTMEDLQKPENKEKLAEILRLHVVSGRIHAPAAVKTGYVDTLAGRKLSIMSKGDRVLVEGSPVVTANLDATNGVIHVIDTVILPKEQ